MLEILELLGNAFISLGIPVLLICLSGLVFSNNRIYTPYFKLFGYTLLMPAFLMVLSDNNFFYYPGVILLILSFSIIIYNFWRLWRSLMSGKVNKSYPSMIAWFFTFDK